MKRAVRALALFLLSLSLNTTLWAGILAGRTEGVFSVSPFGAAIYQIPITVQQGLSTFSPEVSLCYNSQGGNGLAGCGWGLTGFPTISVVPRSIYYDGKAECQYQGGDNALALDGMRLLLKSGTNGTVGATYCTENDQGAIIEVASCANGTPASFTVKTTDGTTYRYGSGTGRRVTDSGEAYGWALDYAEDALGNYISYVYGQEGMLYPLSVTYGKNVHGDAGVPCTITFAYEDRPDSLSSYLPGCKRHLTKRLARITCKYGDCTCRTYDLAYSGKQHSHLIAVSESGLSSASFRPTTFVWHDLPGISLSCERRTMETGLQEEVGKEYCFSGDVDGDGLAEVISMGQRTVGGRPRVYFEGRKWNAESGKFVFCLGGDTQSGLPLDGMDKIFTSVQDGGLCMHASRKEGNSVVFPYLDIQDGLGFMEFHFLNEGLTLNYPLEGTSKQMPCYAILDADRDGLDEIFLLEKESGDSMYSAHMIRCDLSDRSLEYETMNFSLADAPDRMACADFNMDGMPDLLVCTSDSYYIYWNRDGHFSDNDRYHGTAFGACDMLRVGDFNGDGLPDLLINRKNSTDWSLAENTGCEANGCFKVYAVAYMNQLGLSASKESRFSCMVQDLDGDGKSEVVIGYARPTKADDAKGRFCILRPEGNSLQHHSSFTFDNEDGLPDAAHIVQGDFDGQGSAELLYYGQGVGGEKPEKGWHVLRNALLDVSSNRIVSITDGLGACDSIAYGWLCDRNVYSVNGTHAFPMMRLHGTFPVVASHTETIANDSRSMTYRYSNGCVHLHGKGFLGFEGMESTSSTGVVTESRSTLDSTYYILTPQSSTTSNTSGTPISSETYKVFYSKVGPCAYTMRQNSRFTRDLLSGFVTGEDCREYKYGTPTSVTQTDDIFTTEQETTLWESPQKGVWIKGLPARIDITRSASQPDADDVHESVIYERDTSTGLVLKETRTRNGLTVSTKSYSYNEYGQVTQCCTSAYGSPDTLRTHRTYNAKGQMRTETDPKGIIRIYQYYPLHGMLKSVTDPASVRTQYSYDGMLRKTSEQTPIGTHSTSCQFTTYKGAAYVVTERDAGKPAAMTYYDAWGRKVAEGLAQPIGPNKYRDYRYLTNGKLGFESFPHGYAEGCEEGVAYQYDDTHRLIASTDTNGKTATWSYGLTQTTCYVDGVSSTTYYYTPDLVSTVEDPAGYADYEYNADGQVTAIYTEASQANYTYDTYGRLVRTADMNGAVREYTYDRNGYPQSKRTGDGRKETKYDKNGTLLSTTWTDPGCPSRTVRYTYDNKWRMTGEDGGSHAFTYVYDQYGRIIRKDKHIRGGSEESIDVEYTYDAESQLISQTSRFGNLSTAISERFGYRNGYMVLDSLGEALAWRMDKQDRWGNTTKASGPASETTFSYDDYGHLLTMDKGGGHALHESYAYDITSGNMCRRNGSPLAYDGMNRLTGWGGHTLSYDTHGNITHMPQVGDYTFDGYRTAGMTADAPGFDTDDSLHIDYYESIERPRRIENSRYRAEFMYDGSGNRIRMDVYVKRNGTFTTAFTRYYLDDNAEVTVRPYGQYDFLYYAGGDAYTAPAVLHHGEVGDSCLYQITRDPLGSVLAYDGTGGRYYHISYTPWGIRVYDGDDDDIAMPGVEPHYGPFYRTYTGHEELWMFGVINANARLYDPYSGRFISPDPLLNSEGGPLLYNPYVYANNNPCRYIDRNGELWFIAVAAVFAGVGNVWANCDDINGVGDFFKYFGTGAAAGALSAVIGPYVVGALGVSGAGFLSGAAAGAVTGALSNQLQAGMNYAILGTPYSFSWKNFVIETAVSSALGGITNGTVARIKGKNFWTGKQDVIPSQALETPSGKIETTVTGFDRSKLTPNELGKLGEQKAREEMIEQGIDYTGGHFRYQVEGVKGYGVTDVVGKKGNEIFILEAKNGPYAKPTRFQRKAIPIMEKKRNIWFSGPKAEKAGLPLTPFNNYHFEVRHYNIP